MKKLLLALALIALAGGAQAALPLTEADYLKNEEARFTAADANKNGAIEKEELQSAFASTELMPGPAARDACMKAGKDLGASYKPAADGAAFKPIAKKDFLESRTAMFTHIDADKNKTVTQEELDAFSTRMVQMCQAAPGMMKQSEELQAIAHNPNLSPEEMKKQMMERIKNMKLPPGAMPPAGSE